MGYDILDFKNFNKTINNITFKMYNYQLTLLALSLFKWENLPEGMDEKWIERYLCKKGECMFFKDPNLGFIVSEVYGSEPNHYDEPTNLKPESNKWIKNKTYKNGVNAVLIRNNDFSIPTKELIDTFSYRLASITRTQDVNIDAQKTPVLIVCTDKQRLTMKNVYSQWSGNEPVIFGDKSTSPIEIKVLKTDAPIVFDKLQIQKHQIMNEFMTFIGINNANQEKRERLVDDEVQANNEQINFFFNTMLKARERACEEINKLFNLNISVKRRIEQIPNPIDSVEDEKGSEEGSEKDSEVA